MFVLGSIASVIVGVYVIGLSFSHHDRRQAAAGFLLIGFGPVVLRLYCEILIVVFRINESLTDLVYLNSPPLDES